MDPARKRLLETRKSLVSAWMKAAQVLDAQGEVVLAGDVRYFAGHLPPVLTDRQRLAAQLVGFVKKQRQTQRNGPERGYLRTRRGRARAVIGVNGRCPRLQP